MEPLRRNDPSAIGGYPLRARIGAGGMGRVYLAVDPGSPGPRAIALKAARAELAEDPAFLRRFQHEVRSAAAVTGPWTLPVLAAGIDESADGLPWMATEYIPGPSLQEAAATPGGRPADAAALATLGLQLTLALDAIHGAGLVHRDLKPANVLLSADGPRVIDFGIARASDHTVLTHTGFAVGSPGYMPPEQVTGARSATSAETTTPAGDLFALGGVLAYAATGRGPFGDGDLPSLIYRVMHEEPDLDGVPEPLVGIVAACLAKDPSGRPRTGLLREWLRAAGASDRTEAPPYPPAVLAAIAARGAELGTYLAPPTVPVD
ncbi:serine/threonine-protein kinase, partial [Mangrovactinospora gilvigrisea]|uniref:serine/threonine-protein kinase n=1 Tax=Mangrovactinospora gilvigrisea TaxID=1428644 RepID=UPI000AA5A2FE